MIYMYRTSSSSCSSFQEAIEQLVLMKHQPKSLGLTRFRILVFSAPAASLSLTHAKGSFSLRLSQAYVDT